MTKEISQYIKFIKINRAIITVIFYHIWQNRISTLARKSIDLESHKTFENLRFQYQYFVHCKRLNYLRILRHNEPLSCYHSEISPDLKILLRFRNWHSFSYATTNENKTREQRARTTTSVACSVYNNK